jgi:fatty-acyl-CoA synthase
VEVWATSCAEWPILQFGCALAGVVLVNDNPANRSHELSFVLRKSRMRALFLHTQGRHSNYKSILEESRAGQTLALEHVIYIYLDSRQWEDFLCEPDGNGPPVVIINHALAKQFWPKGDPSLHSRPP